MTTKIPVELSSTPGIVDGSNATAITIDSSENVGIGETSPTAGVKLHITNATQVNQYLESTGNTTNSILQNGADGTSAYVFNRANLPLTFGTNNTERMRIDASGNLGIGITSPSDNIHILGNNSTPNAGITIQTDDTASAQAGITLMSRNSSNTNVSATLKNVTTALQSSLGITFGSDTAAANALDDYEEGTWTAVLSDSTGGFAASATSFSGGQYNKIGNMVTAHIYTGSFNITNAGSGYAKVSGLPYTSRAGAYDYGSVIFYHCTAFQTACPTGYVAGGADFTIASIGDQSTTNAQSWKVANGVYLMLQVQYQAD